MSKLCSVCGKPAFGYYGMCKECMDLKKDGKIIKCTDCGAWRKIDETCKKCGEEHLTKENEKATNADEQPNIKTQLKCIICGGYSGKYDLCYDCYRKKVETQQPQYTRISQEDMTAFIESEKDSGIDIREKWPAKIRCEDGHKVRSHAECRIDDWLRNHNVPHDYERMVLSKSDKSKFLLCDFYIPDANLYLEYWGYKDKATYQKRREEKIAIYRERGLICEDLEDHNLEVLDDTMTQILAKYFPDKF